MIKTKVLIIGSGLAGYTASIYTSRAKLKPILITGLNNGGQITKAWNIENWPGEYKGINGIKLISNIKKQSKKFKTNIINDNIIKIKPEKKKFIIIGENNKYISKTIIIATGSIPKKIGIPLEEELYGKGISTCSLCDGYFYKNKNIAIIGGGNSAIEEAIFLSKITKKIFLIHRRNYLKVEKILINKLKKIIKKKKIIFYKNYILLKIKQKNNFIYSIKIKSNKTNKKKNIKINGLFISIGYYPNTKIFKNFINLDNDKYIITNINKKYKTMTNINGIFAAGDVVDKNYRQAITASASGCMAAIDVQKYLENNIK